MKTILRAKRMRLAVVLGAAFGIVLVTSQGQPKNQMTTESSRPNNLISLQFESSIPLAIQSDGVEWKGFSYHLVKLGSVRFRLDEKAGHLSAEVQAGVTTFDEVDYDISAAVFDAEGRMLGVARAQCHVQREWLGRVLQSSQTLNLDFGRSLDYQNAAAFAVTVSKRKVLTPNDWQKSK